MLGEANQELTFVCTGGLLPADTYTVTLRSTDSGFRAAAGDPLDGHADGVSGDDYHATFTVAAWPAGTVTVSRPDMARGAGQPVNVPAAAASLPIRIANAASLTSLAVDVVYDPALLSVTAAARAPGIPADWMVNPATSTAGVAQVTAWGTSPRSGAEVEVRRLTAAVPHEAP